MIIAFTKALLLVSLISGTAAAIIALLDWAIDNKRKWLLISCCVAVLFFLALIMAPGFMP